MYAYSHIHTDASSPYHTTYAHALHHTHTHVRLYVMTQRRATQYHRVQFYCLRVRGTCNTARSSMPSTEKLVVMVGFHHR